MSLSEDLFRSHNIHKRRVKNLTDSDHSTAYEVFRNNTTAVEVIVKEVPSNKKKAGTQPYQDVTTTKNTQDEIQKLKNALLESNNILEKSHNGFQVCMREIQKRLNFANQREMDIHTKYLNLKLENEKLRTLLSSKTTMVSKLSKEMNVLKHIMKSVIKNMVKVPKAEVNSQSYSSDPDYDDFENNLKRDSKFSKFEASTTLDSSVPKEVKKPTECRLYE